MVAGAGFQSGKSTQLLQLGVIFLSFALCASVDIQSKLNALSLRQRLGQMTCTVASDNCMTAERSGIVDKAKVEAWFRDTGSGIMFAVWPPSGGEAWKCSQWAAAIRSIQESALKVGGIPIMFALDSVRGANFIGDATLFPHNIGTAATFNPELVTKRAWITAKDMRTCGFSMTFQPTADIGLQPLWARHYETFGDDPYLTSVLTAANIIGSQSVAGFDENFDFHVDGIKTPWKNGTIDGNWMIATSTKHWIGYSVPDNGADRQRATIPEWALRRYHYPAFRAAMDFGVLSMMISSGWVNNVAGHANKRLLVDFLRTELGWKNGFMLTDFEDINGLIERGVASSYTDATEKAINAGSDVSLAPRGERFINSMMQLIQAKKISESRVNGVVTDVLKIKEAVGLFEKPFPFEANIPTVGSLQDRLWAQRVVEEGTTLLKNKDNTLPLNAAQGSPRKRILVTGAHANRHVLMAGAWTFDWQGAWGEQQFLGRGATIFTGIQNSLKAKQSSWEVEYVEGCNVDGLTSAGDALNKASQADYVVVAIGEKPCAEMICGIGDLQLPGHMVTFVRDLKMRTQGKVILILIQGRPRYFTNALDVVDAVLYGYLPGPEGGTGIANILFGDVNPSGKLPFAYPKQAGVVKIRYTREDTRAEYQNQWDFGFGLSYTKFEYSRLTITPEDFTLTETSVLVVSVDVTNVGDMEGQDVVMLFMSERFDAGQGMAEVGGTADDNHRLILKRFKKLKIGPKQTRAAQFALRSVDFRYLIRANGPTSALPVRIRVGLAQGGLEGKFTLSSSITSFPVNAPDNLTPIGKFLPIHSDIDDTDGVDDVSGGVPVAPPQPPPMEPPADVPAESNAPTTMTQPEVSDEPLQLGGGKPPSPLQAAPERSREEVPTIRQNCSANVSTGSIVHATQVLLAFLILYWRVQ